jgi:amidase
MGPMTNHRISALLTCVALLSAAAHAAARVDITEITIAETQRAIAEHRISCHEVIEQYLQRIRAYDQSTRLNALVLVNPNAAMNRVPRATTVRCYRHRAGSRRSPCR